MFWERSCSKFPRSGRGLGLGGSRSLPLELMVRNRQRRARSGSKMAVLMLSMVKPPAVTWAGGGGLGEGGRQVKWGEGSSGEGVGFLHSSSPSGTCLPQTLEMGADGEKKGSRQRQRQGKARGQGREGGRGEGREREKKGMR